MKTPKHSGTRFPVLLTALLLALSMCASFCTSCESQGKPSVTENPIVFVPGDDEPQNGLLDNYGGAKGMTYPNGYTALPVSSLTLDAKQEDITALPVGTALTVKTSEPAKKEDVAASVRVTPATALNVEEVSDTVFRIAPVSGTWKSDTLYRLSLGDPENPVYSYAFQTEHKFAVKSGFPGNGALSVPTNTGIEITFTDPVKNADLTKYLSVSPAVSCTCSLYPDGRTAVIVPKKLEKNTVYTVTVKAGLPADNGEALDADYVLHFQTAGGDVLSDEVRLELYGNTTEYVFSPKESGVIQLSASMRGRYSDNASLERTALKAKIYRYRSVSDALDAITAHEAVAEQYALEGKDYTYPTEGLSKVFDGDLSAESGRTWSAYEQFLVTLPALDAGQYLCEITYKCSYAGNRYEKTVQLFVQSSDLRVFTESCENSTLVWINRANGTAADNTDVTAYLFDNWNEWKEKGTETVSVKTDKDGIAYLDTNGKSLAHLLVKNGSDTQIVSSVLAWPTVRDGYRSYLYTDREVYFSDDTVRFWGVIEPMFPGQTLPASLYLCLGSAKTGEEILLSDDGSFSGTFSLDAWSAYGMSYSLRDKDGKIVCSDFIRVTQEEKPVYRLSLSFDKLFYTYGETATVTAKVSFFDGTPVPGISLYLNASPYGSGNEVITDTDGQASYSFRTGLPRSGWTMTDPMTLTASAELIGYETTSLNAYTSAYYFHASANFYANRIDDRHSEVRLYKLDTGKLLSKEDFHWSVFPKNTDGEPFEGTVQVTLQKTEYIRHESGSNYDPITKRVEKLYTYTTNTTVEKSFTAKTVNGTLTLDHVDHGDFNGFHSYIIDWTDPQSGHTYRQVLSADKGKTVDYDRYTAGSYYHLDPDIPFAKPGDRINVSLMYSAEPVKETLPVLFTRYTANEGRADVRLSSSYDFTFRDNDILGTKINAAVFENGIYYTANTNVSYDYESENALSVTVGTDKESYRPGEIAVISVDTDLPVSGLILVSVADEACFALGDQEENPLSALFGGGNTWAYEGSVFRPVWVPNVETNTRFPAFSGFGYYGYAMESAAWRSPSRDLENGYAKEEVADEAPAEKDSGTGGNGEGSSVHVRENFADNPYFAEIRLENGHGTTEFTVPDNITSWRVTAVAVSGLSDGMRNTRIGAGISDTVCTQEYFLNVSACELYITGDDIAFSVRSNGTALSSGNAVYTAKLYNDLDEMISEKTITAEAREQAWFNFGALEAGTYSVTVTGSLGDYADAVKTRFTVTDTGVLMEVRRNIPVSAIPTLSPKAYPVTLIFHDSAYDTYLAAVSRLSYAGTSRTDALAASYAAQKANDAFYGTGDVWYRRWFRTEDAKKTLSAYYGFLPLLSYGEGDPTLTAKILTAVPDVLSAERKASLATSYETFITNTEYDDNAELCAAMAALAALGEPVLPDLYALASAAGSFTAEEKLLLCTAFANAGDYSAAREIFANVTDGKLGKNDRNEIFFEGKDSEETIRLTAAALLAVSKFDRSTAEGMVRYLLSHTSNYELYTLEIAAYVSFYLPTEVKEVSFTYAFGNGEPETVTLRGGERHSLTLTKSAFENLRILNADDTVTVLASYAGTAEEALADRKPSGELKLSKSLSVYDEINGLYLVTIEYSGRTDRDYISFSLADCIPSGARFVSTVYTGKSGTHTDNSSAWIYQKAGQQMAGSISAYARTTYDANGMPNPTQPYSFSGSVSYLIRGAVKGEFAMEPAVALSYDTFCYALTDSYKVTISDEKWTVK